MGAKILGIVTVKLGVSRNEKQELSFKTTL